MNIDLGRPRVGQWYTRSDIGEIFQVIGYDEDLSTIEVQTFDGDLDEIDVEAWPALPLAFAVPPEDWTGPMDDVERDDLGYTETGMRAEDWAEPLRSLREEREVETGWQDETEEDEVDTESEVAETLIGLAGVVAQQACKEMER